MLDKDNLLGVILAGGQARRMGGLISLWQKLLANLCCNM